MNEEKNIAWDQTPIFKIGKYALTNQLNTLCGEKVFGYKINYSNRARDSVFWMRLTSSYGSYTWVKGNLHVQLCRLTNVAE